MVYPYKKDELVRTDAFRGPLASAFKLHLEDLTVFQDPKRYVNYYSAKFPSIFGAGMGHKT